MCVRVLHACVRACVRACLRVCLCVFVLRTGCDLVRRKTLSDVCCSVFVYIIIISRDCSFGLLSTILICVCVLGSRYIKAFVNTL